MRIVMRAAVLSGLIAAPCFGQAFSDDFSSGTDSNWTRADLLAVAGLGTTIYDASSGRYEMSSSNELPPLPMLVFTGSFWTGSLVEPLQYSDGTVRATVNSGNEATNLAIAARIGPDIQSGYLFFLDVREGDHAGGIGISSILGNVTEDLVEMPFPLDPGTDYHTEAQFIGSSLSFKVWAAGQPEPLEPQLTVIDAMHTIGGLGISIYNQPTWANGVGGRIAGAYDDVSFVPEPTGLLALLLIAAGARRIGRCADYHA